MSTPVTEPPPAEPQPRGRFGSSVTGFFNSIADAGLDLLVRRRAEDARGGRKTDIEADCHELLSTLGEASGTAIARRVMRRYEAQDAAGKLAFFQLLREKFHVDFDAIRDAAQELSDKRDDASLARFLNVAEPPRQELFRRLNMAPHGTGSLVEMRRALLAELSDHPELRPVDADLRHLFTSWFNRGFLMLRRIDWGTPAAVLEKLIEYETVHEMRGWDDLRRRLAPDRRCFAFFHSALPDDPLVFVEVALTKGIAREIEPIIGLGRAELPPEEADTAIFYSINNCHDGLRGISFGNFLIKQVVVELARELPQLRTFSTLSPVPGFGRWLHEAVIDDPATKLVTDDERQRLDALDDPGWHLDAERCKTLKPLLSRLIARYLVHAKLDRDPLDPVARFHLRNGARLDQINWLGDRSDERLRQSCGFLVNYVYDLTSIEKNHEAYVKEHSLITSDAVARLAGKPETRENAA